MSTEWKPGDVALRGGSPAIKTGLTGGLGQKPVWATARGMMYEEEFVSGADVRRLVVIDPENEDDVTRLADALVDHHDRTYGVHSDWLSIQAALREFANPTPPIEEPTGLGAVVEAINNNHFVRVGSAGWVHVDDCAGEPCDWRDIAVVRVVSEGVTP